MPSKRTWTVVWLTLCLAVLPFGMVPAAVDAVDAAPEPTPPECPEGFYETAGDVWAWGPRFRMLPNNGSAWQDPTLFLDDSGWLDIAINNSTGDIWALNYHDSRVMVLPYNGSSWQVRPRFPSSWEGSYALSVNSNTGDVWAIDYSGRIAMLEGGTGASWQVMPSPGNQLYAWYTLSVNSTTGEVWVINRFDGRTFVLPNGGATWHEETSLPSGASDDWRNHWVGLSVNSSTAEVWALRGDGKVMMLPSGGEIWQEKPPVGEPSFKISVNSNTGDVWVVQSPGIVRMLPPSGTTWQDKPHLGSTGWYGFFVVAPSCTPEDTTAPTASPSQSPAENGFGWNNSDVTVTWHWADEEGGSGIDSSNCTTSSTSTGEGDPFTLSASCKDLAGNTGERSSEVRVDKTKPTLSPAVSPNPVLLNGTASATSGAADALSGLASQSCGALDTSTVGSKNVTCTATDKAGNTNSADGTYNVAYDFVGFFQPVDNLVWNTAKAGQAIPVKFSLGGDQGLSLFRVGFPKAIQTACPGAGTPADAIETYAATAGGSALSYDALSGQYNYVWKTEKAWAGKCFRFELGLMDLSSRTFQVQFTK